MYKKMLTAACLLLLASSSFAAQPASFYAGLDAGSTEFERTPKNETSFGGFVGYNFSTHWAGEVAVRRLGQWDLTGGDLTATQASLSVVATAPIGKGFDLFARVGYSHVNVDNSSRLVTLEKGSTNGAEGALGLAYHFTPAIAARVEAQLISSEISNISAGIVFSF